MSKKNKNIQMGDIMRNIPKDPNKAITECLNKKGKIKCDNKKATKIMKCFCAHHRYTKKGKLKPTLEFDGNGTGHCTMCGAEVPVMPYSSDQVEEIVNNLTDVINNTKFLADSCDAGAETLKYLGTVQAMVEGFPKTYNKTKNVVMRQNEDKGKNRKKGNKGRSGSVSGWRL